MVWRLASERHPPLTGEGARLAGGRWNSPGRPVIYTSESLALCLAECLVHVPGRLPRDYVALKIGVPEDSVEFLDVRSLGPGWQRNVQLTRAAGDDWIAAARTVALGVPSAVLPESLNLLLNPLHRRAEEIEVLNQWPFEFDARLRPS